LDVVATLVVVYVALFALCVLHNSESWRDVPGAALWACLAVPVAMVVGAVLLGGFLVVLWAFGTAFS
jgi:hypothetical protein